MLELCDRSMMPVTISRPMCRTSSGWIPMISGASVSSLISTIPWNIAQSLMLKAGTAKLCSLATSRIALPVVSIAVFLLMTGGLPLGERVGSCLDGARGEAAEESPLEDQEQDEHRNRPEDAHGHHLVPLVRVLAHEQL